MSGTMKKCLTLQIVKSATNFSLERWSLMCFRLISMQATLFTNEIYNRWKYRRHPSNKLQLCPITLYILEGCYQPSVNQAMFKILYNSFRGLSQPKRSRLRACFMGLLRPGKHTCWELLPTKTEWLSALLIASHILTSVNFNNWWKRSSSLTLHRLKS